MKKLTVLLALLLSIFLVLSACGNDEKKESKEKDNKQSDDQNLLKKSRTIKNY